MKRKDWIIIFTMFVICFLGSCLVSVAATGNLFDSNEVSYDNTSSGMSSTNVKAAVDELYAAATDYTNLNSRVTSLEGYFTNNPTTKIDGNGINVGRTNTSANSTYINLYKNNVSRGTILADATSGDMQITSRNTSGTFGTGNLSLYGDIVTVGKSTTAGTVKLQGSSVQYNGDPIIRSKKTGWGSSLTFNMDSYAQHAIVCVSQGYMYLFWLAGDSSNPQLNVTRIYGTNNTDPNGWTTSVSGKTITVSITGKATITAFIGP